MVLKSLSPLRTLFYCLLLVCAGVYTSTLITSQTVYGEQPLPETPIVITPDSALISQPIFRENEGAVIRLNPEATASTTNLIFYIQCPSTACPENGTSDAPVYLFNNETLSRGDLPFSEYWEPPALTGYIIIEYRNDAQQFSCSGITWEECARDQHFVRMSHFSLVDKNTTITPEMLANESGTITSTPSTLTSDLATDTIITTTLDNTAASDSTVTSPLSSAGSVFGTFVSDIITSIVDAILPGDQSGSSTPTPETPASPTDNPQTNPPPAELPVITTDPTNNETITTQF